MPITPGEKRAAAELALASTTFSRAHSLRAFLRYICEMEIEGRGLELVEHKVGVEALGRPPDYSTGEDSTVRSQAHVLRKKLDDLYQKECPHAEVRIELGKGSYRPQFIRNETAVQVVAARPAHRWFIPTRFRLSGFTGGLLVGAVLTATFAVALFRLSPGGSSDTPRYMRDAWGPLLNRGTNAVLCLGMPVNLWVRDLGETPPHYPTTLLSMPGWPNVARYYEQTFGPESVRKLYLQPHRNAVQFGDAAAAAVVVRALARAGVAVEIVPEQALTDAATQNRDVILFGKPEFSLTTRSLLNRGLLNIAVAGETGEYVIVENRGDGVESVIATPKRDPISSEREEYGLITVMPGGSNGNGRRTVAFSGIGSGSIWGAAEFFCSSRGLEDLNTSFLAEGRTHWPQAYQVLLRVIAKDGRPSATQYVTHRVLGEGERPQPGEQARREGKSYVLTVAKR
jgi:hypothetical protein